MESTRKREKRMLIMLFVPLIVIGGVFCNTFGHNIAVLFSGIVALGFYTCLVINKLVYFSERLHWWLCLSTLIAGVVFLFCIISAIEEMK